MTAPLHCARGIAGAIFVAVSALLAGCSNTATVAPSSPGAILPAGPAATTGNPVAPSPTTPAVRLRSGARWVQADWADLPGWADDRTNRVLPALLASCGHPAPAWAATCNDLQQHVLGLVGNDDATRGWLRHALQPWRVESLQADPVGLATGYFEPLVEASRHARPGFRVPLYAPPPDLAARRPYWTRRQVDTLPAARRSLRGSELAWLRDPLDALLLQVQGSGRLIFVDARGRPQETVRVAFAGHNEQPYRSVGRWLVDQGELTLEQASWPAIRAWAARHPDRVDEMLWSNPRLVFFHEEALADPTIGPKGAQGVPLTPGRSIAVDPQSIPYGTPVWLDTTEPLSAAPLRRLVVAQDTGSAITGAVRADYFWGWGDDAEASAGRMKQPLRMWALWPSS
ncbi:MAG TPA: MltA domain-containing protein [Caldimonas sp.]|nr:MltA domain-containing protein [Caldimonas sp.]